jgi:hypothetical protein
MSLILWITLYLFAYRARSHVFAVTPDGIQQLVATENATLMTDEVFEHPKLGRRSGTVLSPNSQCHGCRIDLDFDYADRGNRRRCVETPKHGPDPLYQLAWAEWLRNVVVT